MVTIVVFRVVLVLLCGGKVIVNSPKKHLIAEQIVEQLLNLLEMNAGV